MAISLRLSSVNLRSGGQVEHTPVGYCHDLEVVVHSDGSLTPNAIVLGNKGDENITRLTFNVTELKTAHMLNPLSEYIAKVIIYNPDQSRSDTNPQDYTIDIDEWIVPKELLNAANTYRCLFTLTERGGSQHTTNYTEQWISHEFTASVNDTLWSSTIAEHIANPIIYTDEYGYLTKNPIILEPSPDHYSMTATDSTLGAKKDIFVKRLELTDVTDNKLDEGLIHRYGIFITEEDNVCYAVKFNLLSIDELEENTTRQQYACLIPKEVTSTAGDVQFFMVATTDDVQDNPNEEHDGFKRWVGNTLNFTIIDNFLETPSLPPEANFLLFDSTVMYTNNGKLFSLQ